MNIDLWLVGIMIIAWYIQTLNGKRLERLWIVMGCLGNALTLTAMAWTHALLHLADQKLPNNKQALETQTWFIQH